MKKLYILFAPIIICGIVLSHITLKHSDAGEVNTGINNKYTTVIIDAGHGGFDGGAVASDGSPEKNINLNISLYLRDYLEIMGIDCVMTRNTDESLEDDGLSTIRQRKKSDIYNRLKLMSSTENCVFLSIHQNFYSQPQYSGMQVFYSPQFNEESSLLAQCIQEATVDLLQNNNERQIKECSTSVYLIYNATKPACLVECGFLSNFEEADKLKTPEYQKQVAFCIAMGVNKFISK